MKGHYFRSVSRQGPGGQAWEENQQDDSPQEVSAERRLRGLGVADSQHIFSISDLPPTQSQSSGLFIVSRWYLVPCSTAPCHSSLAIKRYPLSDHNLLSDNNRLLGANTRWTTNRIKWIADEIQVLFQDTLDTHVIVIKFHHKTDLFCPSRSRKRFLQTNHKFKYYKVILHTLYFQNAVK